MKARDYAISLGLAKAGRGKLSREAHAAIQRAIADGQTFNDYRDGRVVRNDPVRNSANVPPRRRSNRNSTTLGQQERMAGTVQSGAQEPFSLPKQDVRHDQSTVYGVDRGGRTEIVIAFDHCSTCFRAVKYCVHDIPQLPAWIGGGNALMEKPA